MARRDKRRRRRSAASRAPGPQGSRQATTSAEARAAPPSRRRRWLLAAALTIPVLAVGAAGYFLAQRDWAQAPSTTVAESRIPTPASIRQGVYVGAERCTQCHATEAAAWRGSHHALAMQHATEASVLGDFRDATITQGGVTSRFFRNNGKFMVQTDGADGTLQDYEIRFTFGVAPLQQYLVEIGGGRLQALPLAWGTRPKEEGGQRWFHLYPGETIAHGDPLHWTGLQQNWNYMCAECHSTNLRRNYDPAADRYATSLSEINVACEACHGPGSAHVAWAGREPGWEQIDERTKSLAVALDERRGVTWTLHPETGNSTRSRPRETMREIETCALCHSRRAQIWSEAAPGAPIGDSHRVALLDDGLYFPDGQIRDEVYEYGSFLQSRMFQAGVTCSDCHEPHSLTLRAPGNGVCLQCHAPEKYTAPSHNHHAPGTAGATCTACHMPERTYMVVDRRRDHSIRIPRPDLSVTLGTPNACSQCHADKPAQWAADQVKQWFATPAPGFQQFVAILRDGTLGAPGARERLIALASDPAQPAIARASALTRLDLISNSATLEHLRKLLQDADALVRRGAVAAYASAPASARQNLLPLLDDPIRDVRLEAAPLLADLPAQSLSDDARRRRDRGIEEYIAAQHSNADRPEAHHNLGLLFMVLGRAAEAEAALKAAIALDATFVPAAVTLADFYRAAHRDAEGEPVLRAMTARQPDAAAPHHALGLWLVRNGRAAEALPELKRAAELGAADPRYGFVYAIALADGGDRAQALEALRQVLAQHPYDRDSLYAMATFARDGGDIAAARRYAEALARLEPNNPGVAALLRQLQP